MPRAIALHDDDLIDIRQAASHALSRLGLSDSPAAQAQTVLIFLDEHLSTWVAAKDHDSGDDEDIEAIVFEMGSLWGEQLVKALQWQWVRVQFDASESSAMGVSSASGSLVIYPFQTIYFYSQSQLPVRVRRSFEILSEPGRVPDLPAGTLENVMDHID